MSAIYDNWERLVAAVLKKQQLWQLFHEQSRSPSIRSEASDFSSSFDFGSAIHDLDFDLSSLGVSSNSQKAPPKLILVSDFSAAFDVKATYLAFAELLGRGIFGSAYAAEMENGVKVVVRKLNYVNISEVEFKHHMEIVGNVRHENVAALRAYYSSKDDRLMLYDYYSNGSVFALLHGENRAYVDWDSRLKIAMGAARGVAEIHTQNGGKLVHGNIKASNIFLNHLDYGCVSDLGMTNMIATTFMPTAKCYAPEIKNTQNVSQASDVYSFGILLLELITRKSPVDVPDGPKAVDLVKLVNAVKSKERTAKVFDADLLKLPSAGKYIGNMLEIGMRCVAKSVKKRPKMSEVVKMLEDFEMMSAESSDHQTRSRSSDPQTRNLLFAQDTDQTFEYNDLLRASAEVLGKGTFGTSYKAILESGDIFKVKRLKDTSATLEEFHQHTRIIGKMRHGNVDKLRASYYSKDEKLILYDYENQSSVSTLLHDKQATDWRPLDWDSRLKIAVGAARGIAHIHTQDGGKLVHGNIKSSNIFLNDAKYGLVANAGLAKLANPIRWSTMRTLAHFAPEVEETGKASQASDVYSFGVLLLELVCGKPSPQTTEDGEVVSLVDWVHSVLHDEWTVEVLDLELLRYGTEEEAMVRLLQIAIDCVRIVVELRPRISQVVKMLEEISGMEINEMDRGEQQSFESRLEDLLEDLLPRLR